MSNITETTWFAYFVLLLLVAAILGLAWLAGPFYTAGLLLFLFVAPYVHAGLMLGVDLVIDTWNIAWNKAHLPVYG